MIHLYCLAVQASFYSDEVECRTLSPADRVRSSVGENIISIFYLLHRQNQTIANRTNARKALRLALSSTSEVITMLKGLKNTRTK